MQINPDVTDLFAFKYDDFRLIDYVAESEHQGADRGIEAAFGFAGECSFETDGCLHDQFCCCDCRKWRDRP